jgi:hypothetical protein
MTERYTAAIGARTRFYRLARLAGKPVDSPEAMEKPYRGKTPPRTYEQKKRVPVGIRARPGRGSRCRR